MESNSFGSIPCRSFTAITKSVRRSRAGLKDPRRPIGVFLFLGPTGVGKTFLPKQLALVTATHRVPLWSIVIHGTIGCALALGGSFATMALMSGGANCLVYIACCAARGPGASWARARPSLYS